MKLLSRIAFFVAVAAPVSAWAQQPNCAEPSYTHEINFCLGEEYKRQDARLNAVYRQVMLHTRSFEREIAVAKGSAAKLISTQKNWITLRDSDCDYVAHPWGNGSGRTGAHLQCLINHTKQRILFLQSQLPEK